MPVIVLGSFMGFGRNPMNTHACVAVTRNQTNPIGSALRNSNALTQGVSLHEIDEWVTGGT